MKCTKLYRYLDFNYLGVSFVSLMIDYTLPEMKWLMCVTFIPVTRDGFSLTEASFSGERTKLKR